jgi:hypothetical protein
MGKLFADKGREQMGRNLYLLALQGDKSILENKNSA